jgi:hypothetical protein
MGLIYQKSHEFLDFAPDINDVIVEIGSDRGEGSTRYFAQLALSKHQKFITVDIRPNIIRHRWKDWYDLIKGSEWPPCDKIYEVTSLPKNIQTELTEKFQFNFETAKIDYWTDNLTDDDLQNIQHDMAQGSVWAKNIFPTYNKKISCLYLDNFDYIWDVDNISPLAKQLKQEYLEYGIEMNNLNCQIEHLSQMIALLPLMADRNIVVCDDTYAVNDCYIGKSGPVVVYLLSQGYKILYQHADQHGGAGIILRKNI